MKSTLLLCSALLVLTASAAQAGPSRPALSVAYFGENATHPGLLLGAELALAEAGPHRLLVGTHLGGYRHPRYTLAAFAGTELGYRFTFDFGLRAELLAGAGYLHTLLDAPVFAPGAHGGMAQVSDAGRSAFMPSTAVGLGWHFDRQHQGRLALFARLQAFWQYPFNAGFLFHPALQVGLSWHFGA
jgi:hypothetical protein